MRSTLTGKKYRPKKKWGQNFLTDAAVVDLIIGAADLTGTDVVIEIGPGLGILTSALAEHAGTVIGIEIDSDLVAVLAQTMRHRKNVHLLNADIMKIELADTICRILPDWGGNFKVVANIPYYLTSPLILKLLGTTGLSAAVLMVQKEVADRLAASPGGKEYGALSVFAQYHSQVEIIGTVPKEAFKPSPRVDSAVVRLVPRPPLVDVRDEHTFFRVVRSTFAQRRKTAANAVAAGLGIPRTQVAEAMTAVGLDPVRRGETFSLEEFALLTEKLSERSDIIKRGE